MFEDRNDVRYVCFGHGTLIHNWAVHEKENLVEVQFRETKEAGRVGELAPFMVRDDSEVKVVLGFSSPSDIDNLIKTLNEARAEFK